MAANRTFNFCGLGYGNSPVTVTATVNGTEIFSGPVPTVDRAPDTEPVEETRTTVLFSLENSAVFNTDFAGNVPMTVSISGGDAVYFTDINCNYFQGNVAVNPAAGTVDNFGQSYYGTPVNSEETTDCRSSVFINGIQQVPPLEKSLGTWCWLVSSPGSISYNWNIEKGQIGNVYPTP
jgi:hypothetical protein